MASHALPAPSFPAWAAGFDRVHVDLGTGDGAYALHIARSDPGTAVFGLDTNLDHLRGSRKRHPHNLRFVASDVLRFPVDTIPVAGLVTINFPYGSILRGLVEADSGLLARLDHLMGTNGRLDIRVNASALTATGLNPGTGPDEIAAAVRHLPGTRVVSRPMTREELRSFPSAWAKRLGFGRDTVAWHIEARRHR
jgi:16S rRNA (adenine(1408)-N(1))-methyltransferase